MTDTATNNPEPPRDIEHTLDALNIDKDSTPEDAAADAAEETAGSSVVEDALGEGEQPADPVVEEEDDGDEEEEEETIVVPLPAASASATPVLVPAPKTQRGRPRKAPAGAVAKIGKSLADKVPGSEKVKVYKRVDGRLHFINDYTTADLAQFPDFESFIVRYVKPSHGDGEYDLVGVDAKNNEIQLGQVRLLAPTVGNPDTAMAGLVQQMLANQQKHNDDWAKRVETMNQPQPQQNPLDLLTGVMALQEKVTGKTDAAQEAAAVENAGGMAAMAQMMTSSGDNTMKMMMMMSQQQQAAAAQQQNMMMQMMMKPKEEDPLMKLMLMKFMEDAGGGGGGGMLPVPPPPPPKESTAELLTAMATFMGMMSGGGGGDSGGGDDFKEFLQTQLAAQPTVQQMIEMMKGGDKESSVDSIQKAADNMATVMNIANNFNRQNEGGPAAGFFDAMAALFSNRDFAGSIATAIRNKTGGGAPPTQQLTPEAIAFRQKLMLQRAQMVQAQQAGGFPPGVGNPGAPDAPIVTPPPGQAPPPGGAGYPPGYPAAVPGGPPVAAAPLTSQTQAAADQKLAQTTKLPELPGNTFEHINNIATSVDEAALVANTVTMLIYFAEFDQWRVFSETVLGCVRGGNKQGTLEYLSPFFQGMAEINMIDATLAKKVLECFDKHFDTVQEQLADIELDKDRDVSGSDLTGEDEADGDAESDGDDGDEGEDKEEKDDEPTL